MTLFSKILILTMLVSGAAVQKSQACSMAPIDVSTQVVDMQRFAYTALGVDATVVTNVVASNSSANYIWSSPMCPEGVYAKATFTVAFRNLADPLTKGCTGQVTVSKTAPTGLAKIPVKFAYNVEINQVGTCLE